MLDRGGIDYALFHDIPRRRWQKQSRLPLPDVPGSSSHAVLPPPERGYSAGSSGGRNSDVQLSDTIESNGVSVGGGLSSTFHGPHPKLFTTRDRDFAAWLASLGESDRQKLLDSIKPAGQVSETTSAAISALGYVGLGIAIGAIGMHMSMKKG